MNDDFTSDALQYLLEEMEPAKRAAFADKLSRDPVAAAAFKTCADSYARFALETAPAVALSEEEHHTHLAAILAETSALPVPTGAAKVVRFPSWIWPVAAAILLLFNIVQGVLLSRSVKPAAGTAVVVAPSDPALLDPRNDISSPALAASKESSAANDPDSARALDSSANSATAVASNSSAGNEPGAVDSDDTLSIDLNRLDDLRHEYARLQRARDLLNTEYNLALEKLTRRALTEQGVGRLAAMELVDADSYARGDRRGLMNLARSLLTEPGIVTADSSTNTTDQGLTATGVGSVNISATDPLRLMTMTVPPPVNPTGAFQSATPQSATTYAWSVFDEKQNQGYLNLYNLPQVASTDSLQLWVKPVDSTEFLAVGQVPAQFYGTSGSLHYQLSPTTATPAQIMVTLEPRTETPAAKPTGPVVLRGP